MKKLAVLLLLLLLPSATAWTDDIYLWFANETLDECPETALDAFEIPSCSLDRLVELSQSGTCEDRVKASYHYLCSYKTDSTCEERLNQRIKEWLGASWTFADCGVLISSQDFDWMISHFNFEMMLDDSFIDFAGGNFYHQEDQPIIDQFPAIPGNQITNLPQVIPDEYDDEGSASNTAPYSGNMALQNPLEFAFFSNISGFPIFLIWSPLLALIYFFVWQVRSKRSDFAQTQSETKIKIEKDGETVSRSGGKFIFGTSLSSMTAVFNLSIYSWFIGTAGLFVLAAILPIFGLASFALIGSALFNFGIIFYIMKIA